MGDEKTVTIGDEPEDRSVAEYGVEYDEPDRGADMPATTIERRDAHRVEAGRPRQARAAMNLWIAGATFEEIAERFDYRSAVVARVVVEEAASKAYSSPDVKSMFVKTNARYERLIRGVMPKAEPKIALLDPDTQKPIKDGDGRTIMVDNPEHLAYVKQAADLIQRQAKLHGVEAPVQVQITPSMEEFHGLVAQVVAQARKDEAEEADIFDEEIEDAELVDE